MESNALLKSKNETQTVIINSFSINDFDKMELFNSFDINLLESKTIIIGKSLAKKIDVQTGSQVVILNPAKLDNFMREKMSEELFKWRMRARVDGL